jgi:hypothetical protein
LVVIEFDRYGCGRSLYLHFPELMNTQILELVGLNIQLMLENLLNIGLTI